MGFIVLPKQSLALAGLSEHGSWEAPSPAARGGMKGQGAGGLSVSKGMPNTVSVPNDGTTDPSHQTDTGCVATEQASEQGAPCVLNGRCALRHCPSRTAFIRTVYKTFGKTTPAPSFLERPR